MFTGKKVRLREYRKEDLNTALTYINDPDIKRLINPGIPYLYTLEDEERWMANNSATKDCYSFAIETLEESKYIGGCGINKIDWKNSWAEIGIFIGDKNYQSKGYGTDALHVLIKFIFEQLNINKIKLNTFSFNKRGIKAFEKVGFKVEGILREELYRDGQYHDIYVMALFKGENMDNLSKGL
ncbi:GNAT family N-acetyltransferase [Anaerobranca gottschalkii]|uniref:Protein N-acetyltransferase, RimJ/RimL family n=1 Tax=Anaerobranca gottschalkii DSM 13577 TaxID=1120990 RepID=A0A1H9ZP81_9FIRM|nr:GNAT family protein [Anaerobranca gottschalkii]SES83375.1 Protein N-acetyltransferase, RimJ/RimL family [Anaerobranca gottschalkii DSM 13577]